MKTFLIIASIILTMTFTACQSTDQTENKTMSHDTMVIHSDTAMQHQQP
jgi:hypothetical protein